MAPPYQHLPPTPLPPTPLPPTPTNLSTILQQHRYIYTCEKLSPPPDQLLAKTGPGGRVLAAKRYLPLLKVVLGWTTCKQCTCTWGFCDLFSLLHISRHQFQDSSGQMLQIEAIESLYKAVIAKLTVSMIILVLRS